MEKPGIAARRTALWLLRQVTGERRALADLLPEAVERLAPRERAHAQRLARETLRWMDRADRMLGPHLRKRPGLDVLNALRLGVVEMTVCAAPPYGVVDTLVSLMRERRVTVGGAALVNAVLRRVTGELHTWETLPHPRMPGWLRRRMVSAYGASRVAAMERAHSAGAPLDITPKAGEPADLAARVDGFVLPTGSVRVPAAGQVSAMPGYGRGDWWVQDASAALPAALLAARSGERVLDMCAAPGGKTMQMAAAGADVTAIDISAGRMARVRENLARTGLPARLVVSDALAWTGDAMFDAVLLDAPCSATGTIRRHPDVPHVRDDSGLTDLLELQALLIDRAATLLRPGGRLIYCTCSLLEEEGEIQIERALDRNDDLATDPVALGSLESVLSGHIAGAGLRVSPDHWEDLGGMDGFFAASLRKASASSFRQ